MSLEAASERMKIEMMSEEGDDDERKAKDKGVIKKALAKEKIKWWGIVRWGGVSN